MSLVRTLEVSERWLRSDRWVMVMLREQLLKMIHAFPIAKIRIMIDHIDSSIHDEFLTDSEKTAKWDLVKLVNQAKQKQGVIKSRQLLAVAFIEAVTEILCPPETRI